MSSVGEVNHNHVIHKWRVLRSKRVANEQRKINIKPGRGKFHAIHFSLPSCENECEACKLKWQSSHHEFFMRMGMKETETETHRQTKGARAKNCNVHCTVLGALYRVNSFYVLFLSSSFFFLLFLRTFFRWIFHKIPFYPAHWHGCTIASTLMNATQIRTHTFAHK